MFDVLSESFMCLSLRLIFIENSGAAGLREYIFENMLCFSIAHLWGLEKRFLRAVLCCGMSKMMV